MAVNFEEIPSNIEIPLKPAQKTRTVLEELNARHNLLNERTIKCKSLRPFYGKVKKEPLLYNYKYFCVCPRYNPQYSCKHTGNIIIDRDVLTREEHIVYLATPKPNFVAPRKMSHYILKKSIVPNCTARINRLAMPDIKHVNHTLNNFYHIISRRHRRSLNRRLQKNPNIECISIQKALSWLSEERRLTKVAKRKERLRCQKLARKIIKKQRAQIKNIIYVLFEEMEDFLLNDQFLMDESSALVSVILETLRKFTDKEFYNMTSNLREYQKILAFNIAVWINKFILNLNIHLADPTKYYTQITQTQPEKPTQELSSFIPVSDYISYSSESEESNYAKEDDIYPYQQSTDGSGENTKANDI